MNVVAIDLGVDAVLLEGLVLAVKPGMGYVRTYAAIRALLPNACEYTVLALTDQACPRATVRV